MSDDAWILALRIAGGLHFVTVLLAHFTPIPAQWDETLARLPAVHRRFALAQNAFIGGTMIFAGGISVAFAPELVSGTAAARIICTAIALWWGARLMVLPWLRVWPELRSRLLRAGFVALHLECAGLALLYGALALRA